MALLFARQLGSDARHVGRSATGKGEQPMSEEELQEIKIQTTQTTTLNRKIFSTRHIEEEDTLTEEAVP
jgi:hypothetical protein